MYKNYHILFKNVMAHPEGGESFVSHTKIMT